MEAIERKPQRIQRKRTKGWKMPEGAVYVGRPTIFGNPFKVDSLATPMWALTQYRRWLGGHKGTGGGGLRRLAVFSHIAELRGKDLACWCPLDQPCHADVLLQLANAGFSYVPALAPAQAGKGAK